jgi:hypothetical protein
MSTTWNVSNGQSIQAAVNAQKMTLVELPSKSGRRVKFTPERIEQIRIAETIEVTVGSLQVTCSRLGISLRRPRSPNFMARPPRPRPVALFRRSTARPTAAPRPTRPTPRDPRPRSASSSDTAGARRSSTCRSRRTLPRASFSRPPSVAGQSANSSPTSSGRPSERTAPTSRIGHRGHPCHEARSLMPSRVGRLSVEVRLIRRYQNRCHNLSGLMIGSCP